MKLGTREPINNRRPQYSSRMSPTSNTGTNRSLPRKGNSLEPTREGNLYYSNSNNEYDLIGLNSMITQATKAPNSIQFNPNEFSKQNLIAQINVK
jgi:hypothetical protein